MWWLQPISWIRWSAAAILAGAAITIQLSSPATVAYPFAADTIPVGAELGAAGIQWRDVPEGLLPAPDLNGYALAAIPAGTPITPDRLTNEASLPSDWWIVELPVSRTATVGSEVRVVVLDPIATVAGVLTALPEPDPFGGELLGAVAVPPEAADLVARASASNNVVTLTR